MIVGMAGRGPYPLDLGPMRLDWCRRCMSSSAVRADVLVLEPSGPRWAGLVWACSVCDPDRFDGGEGGDGDVLVRL